MIISVQTEGWPEGSRYVYAAHSAEDARKHKPADTIGIAEYAQWDWDADGRPRLLFKGEIRL